MERCHCGQPLHYTDPDLQLIVERLITLKGSKVMVHQRSSGRTFLVPRHFIALHGLQEQALHELGFQEVEADGAPA